LTDTPEEKAQSVATRDPGVERDAALKAAERDAALEAAMKPAIEGLMRELLKEGLAPEQAWKQVKPQLERAWLDAGKIVHKRRLTAARDASFVGPLDLEILRTTKQPLDIP
jgi:hypothetical protein